jgi:hypothetical protein
VTTTKKIISLFCLATIYSVNLFAIEKSSVDWSKPPMACVEEIVPIKPNRPCLDFSSMTDIYNGLPEELSEADKEWWMNHARELRYCRSGEALKRESQKSGSFTKTQLEISWMQLHSVENFDEKVSSVYRASRFFQIPEQILAGAIKQESIFMNLGVSADGENYSCGVGQINIQEWCHWVNSLSPQMKTSMKWPQSITECESLPTTIVEKPYKQAVKNLNGLPEYQLNQSHFKNIDWQSFISGDSSSSDKYRAVKSFVDNCQNVTYGIYAKAHELTSIFNHYIPEGLRETQQYDSYSRKPALQCREEGQKKYYPLHTGWLLAVGSYNAGPRAVDLVSHYLKLTSEQVQYPVAWKHLDPQELVSALYWGGKYGSILKSVKFKTLSGERFSWPWFKSCVVQRHVANVANNGLKRKGGVKVESFEGDKGCVPGDVNVFNQGVSSERSSSSGVKKN